MAIHDAVYQTRPATFRELRWRLVHLMEERVGKHVSQANLDEAARERAAIDAINGLGR